MRIIIFILFVSASLFAQVEFDKYFYDKTLRIDYYHTGNNVDDFYSIDELKEEPYWGGPKDNLIDIFNYGIYTVKVFADSSNILLYSHGYSTLFNEWQTTDEAKITTKTFSETITLPYPKERVRVEFFGRDEKNNLLKKFEYFVDPENYFISTERKHEFDTFQVLSSGNSADNIDIVFIPEGYTKEQLPEFKKDAEKFSKYLFQSSPYKENKNKFNIWGVNAPSDESGTDIPANDEWKKTLLNTRFYTFDLDRYVMTDDNKTVRDVAANAPYDITVILVNSTKYGGGAIYNHYACLVNNNPYEEYIMVHEFSHAFASLADEYYTGSVAYNDFYKLDVEPLDPNLTTLIDFDSKWKDLVEKDTPIPTPPDDEFKNKVGAFEGGGYVAKGIYRPQFDCTMKSISTDNFCKVCKKAIGEMINFYAK